MTASETALFVTEDTLEHGLALARDNPQLTVIRPEELSLDVQVTPPYLTRSYACYRALGERGLAAAIFTDGADAYCAARARETGTGLAATRVVVDCVAPRLRSIELGQLTYVSKNVLGAAVAERLALEVADGYLCAHPQVDAWLARAGWQLPPRLASPFDRAGRRRMPIYPREAPLISVVVPYHERTRYLPFCLEGLARQTYSPLEVVVVDDGSTSAASRAQLEQIEQQSWPWPLRVLSTPGHGPEEARNTGWREARGALVTFIDDDDVPFDEMVEMLWGARETSGADVAVGAARLFRGEEAPAPQPHDIVRIPLCDPHELGLISNQYGGPVALWPRPLLESVGGFARSPIEDWLLLARATMRGARTTASPEPVYWYRQTASGRHSVDPVMMRDAGVPQITAAFAERLPADLRLLPLLAAGAYAELERRNRAGRSRKAEALRLLARRIARR